MQRGSYFSLQLFIGHFHVCYAIELDEAFSPLVNIHRHTSVCSKLLSMFDLIDHLPQFHHLCLSEKTLITIIVVEQTYCLLNLLLALLFHSQCYDLNTQALHTS